MPYKSAVFLKKLEGKMKANNTIRRTIFSALSLGLLVFFVACGGSDENSEFTFEVSEETLEVVTLIEGIDLPAGLGIDLDATAFKNHIFATLFGSGEVVAISRATAEVTTIVEGLAGPTDMLFDILENAFFVTEGQSNRISRVDFNDSEAVAVTEVAQLPQGEFPQNIATDGQFRYVTARNTSLQDSDRIYNISTNSPKVLAEGGNFRGLAFRLNDERPELLVTDVEADAVFVMPIDNQSNEVITNLDVFADEISEPADAVVGPSSGFVYVAAAGSDQVLRLSTDGKNRTTVANIVAPFSLKFDDSGRLYVSSRDDGGKVLIISGLDE